MLSTLMSLVRRLEGFLGPRDDWVEDDRRILFEAAQYLLGDMHTFTREKGVEDYITTAHADSDVVETALMNSGYDRNLLSTRKYRTHHSGGKQWGVGSFAYDPADTDWQHHVYLFEAPNGGTDVYGHREPSVRDPDAHLDKNSGVHGDPNGRVATALDAVGVEYGERQDLSE
jgi:hypothetical protein